MRERDVRDNAAPEKCVIGRLLGAVEKLVNQNDVARFVFFLQRTDRADADDRLHTKFFHRPNVRAMVQFTWQNSVAASMSREKYNFASAEFASKKIIRRRAERSFDFRPFLIRETFDVVKSRAADDSNPVFFHAGIYSIYAQKAASVFSTGAAGKIC
jgi:hypothetical protein